MWIAHDFETLALLNARMVQTANGMRTVGGEHVPKHLDWWCSPALAAEIVDMALPPGIERVACDTSALDAAIGALQTGEVSAADAAKLRKLRERREFARSAVQFCTLFDGAGHHITQRFIAFLNAIEAHFGRARPPTHVGRRGVRSWEERARWYARCELLREWYCRKVLG